MIRHEEEEGPRPVSKTPPTSSSPLPRLTLKSRLYKFYSTVIFYMESVGGVVSSIFGLDESMFQDVCNLISIVAYI